MNIDDTARAASGDVRQHVAGNVEPAPVLRELTSTRPGAPRRSGRVVAVAAALVVLAGGLAFAVARQNDDGSTTVEFVPTAPRIDRVPAKPDDGLNSIRLPITADPSTGLRENSSVTVSGPGFVAGEQVAVVECVATPDGSRGGIDGCDLASITYGSADAQGVATVEVLVHRIITTARDGTVDCAISTNKCSLGMGSINDYDRSGGIAVDFDASQPAPDDPTIAAAPASGLKDGDEVTISGEGLVGAVVLYQCAAATDGERSNCLDLGGPVSADAEGHFAATVAVHRLLGGAGSYAMDCGSYPGACVIVAQGTGQAVSRPAALNFDKSLDAPLPVLSLLPAGALHDGQLVQLEGSSYTPGATIAIAECGEGPARVAECIQFAPVTVQPDGTFAVSLAVAGTLTSGADVFRCTVDGPCQISAMPSDGFAADDLFLEFAAG